MAITKDQVKNNNSNFEQNHVNNNPARFNEDHYLSDYDETKLSTGSGDSPIITKELLGLGNVDNTSDLNKPISNAVQAALNAKADLVNGKIKSSQLPDDYVPEIGVITKSEVGLGNVDNTSDLDKPVSTAQQTALDGKVPNANIDTSIPETPVDTHVPSTKLVNDKFVKHNTYDGTLSVKKADEADVAKNIKAYSSDSGALQENPFISQGTGTNDNTEIVTTGNTCEIKSKNGNTIVVNQLVPNPTFTSTTGWTASSVSLSVSNNVATLTSIDGSDYGRIISYASSVETKVGHKYLTIFDVRSDDVENCIATSGSGWTAKTVSTSWQTYFVIAQTVNSISSFNIGFSTDNDANDTIQFRNVYFIDLTQMFNGNIPQDLLDNPSHITWYVNNFSYNTGSLVNATGRYLECGQGRNLWDEVATNSGYILDNGTIVNGYGNRIASTNYIDVIPNMQYAIRVSYAVSNYGLRIAWYDKDKNKISVAESYTTISGLYSVGLVTAPANAWFMRFNVESTGYNSSTYKKDITVSKYYTPEQGGEGYNQYYPYVAPKVIDTGSEELLAFDKKTPDGTIYHNSGEKTFTGEENVYLLANNVYYVDIVGAKTYSKVICNKLLNEAPVGTNYVDGSCWFASTEGRLYLYKINITSTSDWQTFLNGMSIQFELATPTTEQGTPFSAYPDINDYSYMLWRDTDNNLVSVPQGASIFYPVNYAGTLDDLVAYVDDDVTNLAKKSDLASDKAELQDVDTILQNAIGGTLRQCLCVKESLDFNDTDVVDLGTINWTYDSTYHYFYSDVFSSAKTSAKCMASKYKTIAQNFSDPENKSVFIGSNNRIVIADNSYTDATTFKNAMKGVLVAYEKASE